MRKMIFLKKSLKVCHKQKFKYLVRFKSARRVCYHLYFNLIKTAIAFSFVNIICLSCIDILSLYSTVLCMIYRGSYMRVHVLLNLSNKLGKRDKMRGLPSILSLFRNEFNKFNNTRARMLDFIYNLTLRLL